MALEMLTLSFVKPWEPQYVHYRRQQSSSQENCHEEVAEDITTFVSYCYGLLCEFRTCGSEIYSEIDEFWSKEPSQEDHSGWMESTTIYVGTVKETWVYGFDVETNHLIGSGQRRND